MCVCVDGGSDRGRSWTLESRCCCCWEPMQNYFTDFHPSLLTMTLILMQMFCDFCDSLAALKGRHNCIVHYILYRWPTATVQWCWQILSKLSLIQAFLWKKGLVLMKTQSTVGVGWGGLPPTSTTWQWLSPLALVKQPLITCSWSRPIPRTSHTNLCPSTQNCPLVIVSWCHFTLSFVR